MRYTRAVSDDDHQVVGDEISGCRGDGKSTVIGDGLNPFFGTGQLRLFTFSVFVRPIVVDTGWDQAIVASAPLCGQFLLALCAPLAGLAIDRFGPRNVARYGGPLLGAGMYLIGFVATNPITFVMVFSASFLLGALQVPITYVKTIAAWYQRRLGLALGTAMLFSGIGVAALPPFAAWLIAARGWRAAYACLGVLVAVINLLSVALLIRQPRQSETVNRAGRLTGALLIRESWPILRSRTFAVMAITFFLVSVVVGAGTWVLPVTLNDQGMNAQNSSLVMIVIGCSMTVARFTFGVLLDRFDPRRLTAVAVGGAAIGMGCLAASPSPAGVVIAGILTGIALEPEVDAMAFLRARAFGIEKFGVMYGALSFGFSLGLGCGPAFLSAVVRIAGTYVPGIIALAAAGAVSALTVLLIPLESGDAYRERASS